MCFRTKASLTPLDSHRRRRAAVSQSLGKETANYRRCAAKESAPHRNRVSLDEGSYSGAITALTLRHCVVCDTCGNTPRACCSVQRQRDGPCPQSTAQWRYDTLKTFASNDQNRTGHATPSRAPSSQSVACHGLRTAALAEDPLPRWRCARFGSGSLSPPPDSVRGSSREMFVIREIRTAGWWTRWLAAAPLSPGGFGVRPTRVSTEDRGLRMMERLTRR